MEATRITCLVCTTPRAILKQRAEQKKWHSHGPLCSVPSICRATRDRTTVTENTCVSWPLRPQRNGTVQGAGSGGHRLFWVLVGGDMTYTMWLHFIQTDTDRITWFYSTFIWKTIFGSITRVFLFTKWTSDSAVGTASWLKRLLHTIIFWAPWYLPESKMSPYVNIPNSPRPRLVLLRALKPSIPNSLAAEVSVYTDLPSQVPSSKL